MALRRREGCACCRFGSATGPGLRATCEQGGVPHGHDCEVAAAGPAAAEAGMAQASQRRPITAVAAPFLTASIGMPHMLGPLERAAVRSPSVEFGRVCGNSSKAQQDARPTVVASVAL